ncbi:MAG: hypothetical protein KKB34_10385 [Bacteroidetes bacterium]|nr:hypothetical protein [Bacteroidota bacterium]
MPKCSVCGKYQKYTSSNWVINGRTVITKDEKLCSKCANERGCYELKYSVKKLQINSKRV